MARTSNLANVATVTRASKAWDPLWDFTSGGTVGTLTEFASGVARYGANGLLVEETSTNEIRNPRGEGATGSTEPTNWAIPASWDAIATWTTGTEDGHPYAQVVFNGTPSGDCTISIETNTQIGDGVTSMTGEVWCLSAGLKVTSGDFTNIDSVKLRHREASSGGVFEVAQDGADIKASIDGSHRRFFYVGTLADADTVHVAPQILIEYTSGAVNFTLRIYAPQYEEKAYPTSPILPVALSPAASTRASDVISVSNGAWANDSAASLYVDVVWNYDPPSGDFGRIAAFGDSITNQMAVLAYSTSGSVAVTIDNSADNALVLDGTAAPGVNIKYALAYAVNDAATSISGQTQATDSSLDLSLSSPVVTLGSGNAAGAAPIGSVYIKEFRFWPRRLSNAELEALVGN